MLVSLAQVYCGNRQRVSTGRPRYEHNLKQREMPTFSCKLAPFRLCIFVAVGSCNICRARKIDPYLDVQPMRFFDTV